MMAVKLAFTTVCEGGLQYGTDKTDIFRHRFGDLCNEAGTDRRGKKCAGTDN